MSPSLGSGGTSWDEKSKFVAKAFTVSHQIGKQVYKWKSAALPGCSREGAASLTQADSEPHTEKRALHHPKNRGMQIWM